MLWILALTYLVGWYLVALLKLIIYLFVGVVLVVSRIIGLFTGSRKGNGNA